MIEDFKILLLMLFAIFFVTSCQQDDNEVANDFGIAALPLAISYPIDNSFSDEKFELGKALFWDPILSGTKDIACATCHHPDFAYADGRDLPSGVHGIGIGPNRINGEIVRRNAPTILNTAFNGIDEGGNFTPSTAPMFWDNRVLGLEQQALLPLLSKEEMRGSAIGELDILDTVIQRLNVVSEYRSMFSLAFGNELINERRIAQALATFQRGIIANNSRFDEYMRGDVNALSEQEIQGMNTFMNVGCADCHSGPMLSDFELHTLSVPNHPLVIDNGANGDFEFRTPSLRNITLTAPYMHNGSFDNLREVLQFYRDISRGNGDSQNPNVNDNDIDQEARDLNMNNGDINEIIAFLNTLTDEDFDRSIPSGVPSGLSVGGNIE